MPSLDKDKGTIVRSKIKEKKMRILINIAIILSLALTLTNTNFVSAQVTEEKVANDDKIDHVEICTKHLQEIGKALKAYHKDHNKYPKLLSDLHPEYLKDKAYLLCPADKDNGNPKLRGNPRYVPDPKIDGEIPTSYDYQLHHAFGYEPYINADRAFYGDVVPIVRCWHHQSNKFSTLNLDFSGRVYKSDMWWNRDLERAYGGIEKAISGLEAGFKKSPDNQRYFYVYPRLLQLYIKAEKEKEGDKLIERFKKVMSPTSIRHSYYLGDMLETRERVDEMFNVFTELLKHHKDNKSIYAHLARTHERLGNKELASEYTDKAKPVTVSEGETVPDFIGKDLEGKPVSIADFRGKVLLVDFWAVWCGPCVAEMPNVKRVYNTYKDQGFDILGISLDNDEKTLRDYLKKNEIPWRQAFDGQGWDSTVPSIYGIRGIPTMWVIDKDGALISENARGENLEKIIVKALQDKPDK